LEKVARHNDQLRRPSIYHPRRETLLQLFEKEGYAGVERYYKANFQMDIVRQTIEGMIPKDLKRSMKKLLGFLQLSKRS
jgi:hypothetical protein